MIDVTDIFYLFLNKWWIILLFVLLGVALFWVRYERQEPRYFRTATVIIRDASSRLTTGGLDRFDHSINKINLTNEIRQFRSVSLFRQVVEILGLDLHYRKNVGMRYEELYSASPLSVDYERDACDGGFSFEVTVIDSQTGIITDIHGLNGFEGKKIFRFGHGFITGKSIMRIDLNGNYNAGCNGQTIRVVRYPVDVEAASLHNSVSVIQDQEESSILNINMSGSSVHLCDDVINTIVEVYNARALLDKNHVVEKTAKFIQQRIRIIEHELDDVESGLEAYRQDKGILTIESTLGGNLEDSRLASKQLDEYESQLNWAMKIKDEIASGAQYDYLPENTGLDIDTKTHAYNEMVNRRLRLADHGGNSNPVNIMVDDRLKEIKNSVIGSLDNVIASLEMKMDESLAHQEESDNVLNSIPSSEREMLEIKRQQKIKESLYLFLLNKREENALSRAMADENALIMDPPHGPSAPVAPRKARMLSLGFVLGLLLSVGGLLARKYFDTRIHSRKDIENNIRVPFIGEIPLDKSADNDSLRRTGKGDAKSIVTEAMRLIRTNISFMSQNNKPVKVITLTSFAPGVGKSFLTHNIARTMSMPDSRVVVVDMDIRKATLTHRIGLNRAGLSTYLSDLTCGESDIISMCGDYDFIPSGPVPPNPAELLMNKRLDALFDYLRDNYDYILADNVPVGMIADSTITNRVADLTIFVLRAGKSDKRQLSDLQRMYDESALKNMCVLLNGVIFSRHYGYYHNYAYS